MSLEKLRNIGIIAHIDAGKTTTTERILYYTGRIHRMGEVDLGSALMDWMTQEQERGITITSASTSCQWNDTVINIIDTPGHVDFTAEVERSLRVLGGAVVVFCAVAGVQPQSEKVWRQADTYDLSRLVFINKMDRLGAEPDKVLEEIKGILGGVTVALQMPVGSESAFSGVVDLIRMKNLTWVDIEGEEIIESDIPEELKAESSAWRDSMLEKLSEVDDKVMAAYLEGEEIDPEMIRVAIRKGTKERVFYPVLFGSSLKRKGVQPLLDAITEYLPSPVDLPPVKGFWNEEMLERRPEEEEPFCALLFKIMAFAGRPTLYYVRVYSGKCKIGGKVINSRTGKTERAMKILRMNANRRDEIKEMKSGDIVALVGLKDAQTGDTLSDPEHPISLERPVFPQPVIFIAIEPRSSKDQEKMMEVLDLLSEEDPTFNVGIDNETGQVILSGMGELHLEVLVNRLLSEFKIEGRVGAPQVSYRETITVPAKATERFAREIAGVDHEASITLTAKPLPHGGDVVFEDNIQDEKIPENARNLIKEAVLDAAASGIRAGYPVIDLRVTLVDGEYHAEKSSDTAVRAAAMGALNQCLREGASTLLEPVMSVQVETPEDFTGEVLGSLTHRRGTIHSVKKLGQMEVISSKVPLKEMFGYTTTLRSLTKGRGTFTMELSSYRAVED